MWILVTIHASITWAWLDDIYIRHGETRETELAMTLNESFQRQHIADAVVTFINLVLADMTMVSGRIFRAFPSLREYTM